MMAMTGLMDGAAGGAHAWEDEEAMNVTDSFERAQQQALEMLFAQCVDEMYAGELTTLAGAAAGTNGTNGAAKGNGSAGLVVSNSDAASFMDFLAQACEDANEKLQEISPDDVAQKLAEAVAATQTSLRDVQKSVAGILEDPQRMQALCQQFDAADEKLKKLQKEHAAEAALLLGEDPRRLLLEQQEQEDEAQPNTQQVAVLSNEESLRSMMQLADNMCGVLDNALSTISKDEYELAAQLSLGIAQKLLEAGQSLFMSIGDESRRDIAAKGDRSDRITIEELAEEDSEDSSTSPKKVKRETIAAKRLRLKREQRKHSAVVRTYLLGLADKAQKGAADHPVVAGVAGMVSLPFIGLAIPVASMVGLALVLEKYYPEHTSLTLEMCGNFVQMAKLWLLLVKISARQLGSVAKQCLVSWHDHAAQHGYAATGVELVTTGCSLSWLCVSYLYNSVLKYARPTSQ